MNYVPYSFAKAIHDHTTNVFEIPGILVLASRETPRLCIEVLWNEPNEYGITPVNVKRYIKHVEDRGHSAEFIQKPGFDRVAGYFMVDYWRQ